MTLKHLTLEQAQEIVELHAALHGEHDAGNISRTTVTECWAAAGRRVLASIQPAETKPVEASKRRMQANLANGAYGFHRKEHDESKSCDKEPACIPIRRVYAVGG